MGRRLVTSLIGFALVLLSLPFAGGAASAASDLFFSEYVEGSSNNKALEIYNGTGSPVDLGAAGYNVQMFFNGSSTAGLTINLTGTVAAGDVFVLAQSSATAAILAQADQTNGAGWFNGDDAVVLRHGTTVLDVIGQIGVDPGTEWGTGLASTADNTLRRKAGTTAGDANGTDVFDPSAQWSGFPTDTFDGLGSHAAISDLFFSEYIEGTSNNKALEIFNGTDTAVDLGANGYNVQMFFNGSSTAGLTINLVGTVAPGDVFVLVQSAASATILAQADQTNGSGWFNGDDTVVLRKGTLVIDVIGQVGFDPGTEWGTGLVSTADNTLRRKISVTKGDGNGADAFDPSLEWDGFATDTFDGLGSHGGTDMAPSIAATTPTGGTSDVAVDANITVTFSEPVTVTGTWYDISCTTSGAHAATASGGPTTFTLDPASNFVPAETCIVTVFASQVSDQDTNDPPDNMTANASWSFATVAPPIFIHDVQGAAHTSPKVGMSVKVNGIVTAKRSNGFYMQEPDATVDADPATSEGIFVFTSSAPTVSVADAVTVTGSVSEFRPGGASTSNLTTTELTGPTIVVTSTGNALPTATLIGAGGRTPPTDVIEDDAASGDVETSGAFDPANDGIDFWESLEGMLVTVPDPAIVGPSNSFNEISVLANGGAGTTGRTPRGGIAVSATDKNPERIIVDDALLPAGSFPTDISVGDRFVGSVTALRRPRPRAVSRARWPPRPVRASSPSRRSTSRTSTRTTQRSGGWPASS
jgi:predicted extracellular nuclease